MDGRPLRIVGWATVYEGGQVVLKLTENSEAGRTAVALLKEDCLDAWYWARSRRFGSGRNRAGSGGTAAPGWQVPHYAQSVG